MTNLTIPQFLEATASDAPVPGGGSVSALCGSLGAALGTMVCRLTLGRKKYAEHQDTIMEILDIVPSHIEELRLAIAADSEAYNKVMNAFKLPKETDEEKAARRAAIGAASLEAANVPMAVAESSLLVMNTIKPLAEKGNQNAITDVGVAMMCLRTAVLGACLNVRINLGATGDQEAERDLINRCNIAEAQAIALSDEVYNAIHKSLQ